MRNILLFMVIMMYPCIVLSQYNEEEYTDKYYTKRFEADLNYAIKKFNNSLTASINLGINTEGNKKAADESSHCILSCKNILNEYPDLVEKNSTIKAEILSDMKECYYNKADAEFFLAHSNNNTGYYDWAIATLDELIYLFPLEGKAYGMKGNIRFSQDMKYAACECWKKAVSLGKDEYAEQLNKYCK